jgi:anaerobic selenocysteine-containing dehydrogenase
MTKIKQVQTVCRSRHGGCGVIAHVKNGNVIKVEGDPESPISHGSICSKGLAITLFYVAMFLCLLLFVRIVVGYT